MKIFLHEITDQETVLDFTQEEEWVQNAVLRVDEHMESSSLARKPKSRDIKTHLSLTKVDDVVVISGRLDTYIELVCSRCATPFHFNCSPKFSALFCKDPVMAGIAHLQRQGTHPSGPAKPMGQNQGFARHAHDFDEDSNPMAGKDLDITYLSHDFIDLGDVLTEQLQLQVPFQPLCKESCKGICSNCGTDLNLGRCACAKIASKTPFSVLKDFKI